MIKFLKTKIIYALYLFLLIEIFLRIIFTLPFIQKRFYLKTNTSSEIVWVNKKLFYFLIYGASLDTPFYGYMEHDSLKGWKASPNLRNFVGAKNPNKNHKRVSTNSKGMRGDKDFSYAKTIDKKRILFLGDSFTFGDEVNDNENYPYFVQQFLGTSYEVMNMGMNGYGHDQMLLWLKEEGLKYKADKIILGFMPLDIKRNMFSFWNYAKPVFNLEESGLKLSNVPVPTFRQVVFRQIFKSKIWEFCQLIKELLAVNSDDWKEKEKIITTAILDEIKKSSEQSGAEFLIIYIPLQEELVANTKSKELEFIESYVKSRKINFFNPLLELKEKAKSKKYKMIGHYDAQLNRDFAESIIPAITGRE